jgi:Uma2 family endonuclease
MQGIPTIIIEILSKSTAIRDVNTKKWLYETHGVPEYWIIDPVHQLVEVYRLQEGKYRFDGHFTKEDEVAVNVFDGFSIALSDAFLL